MDKQKQVEEMAVDIAKRDCSLWEHCPKEPKHNCVSQDPEIMLESSKNYITIATWLVDVGYRKIPEGAVVLTKEEYNKLEQKIADLKYDENLYKKLEEEIVDLKYNKFELMNEISEKDNKIALLEETIECIKFNVDFTRKETAEKFAEMAKQAIVNMKWAREDTHIKLVTQEACLIAIDEICKELTEGKR